MIGEKIKTLRAKNGMTQKDLADKLFVTSQAVSRWENGEVEPSIGTVSEMAKIFNVTIDSLVNDEVEIEEPIKEEKVNETAVEPVVEEKIVYKEAPKVHLCLCEKCNSPIYEKEDIHRFSTTSVHRSGRVRNRTTTEHIYCTKCYNIKKEEERLAEEARIKEEKERMRNKRIHSFVWPGIVAAIIIIVSIVTKYYLGILGGVLAYTFIADLILGNNFIGDLWLNIASWSVKLPGVIFTLDLDGIIWLLTVKLLGAILSFFLSVAAVLLATSLGMALSIFVYPVALIRNINGKDESVLD